ncbi:Carboxyvinyl-carboxyphosphonate phosphorylmutase [Venturia nashicola]|nr:Carboxyvinyl-carboxyphosphonate phosphorylmutase [Venturia nashicola]
MTAFTGTGSKSAAERLREPLTRKELLVCPGVYDGLTARIALREGFDCLYMTGAGTAASRLGMPDLGVLSLNDMVANAGMIASLDRKVPLIADADTGFGGPIMVARTIRAYITAGVAGLHIEDQVVNNRCGHLGGKEMVDDETYFSRIRAAVLAREEMRQTAGGDIVIIARTDALQSLGYDVAVSRLRKCIELGADVAFLEGPQTTEQCQNVCKDLAPHPVLLNMVPGGTTPLMGKERAQGMGFKICIWPVLGLSAAYAAVTNAYQELMADGEVKPTLHEEKEGVKSFFGVCGLDECTEFDKKAGGVAYSKGI